jgi:FMN-dependent NADH-azoreductase
MLLLHIDASPRDSSDSRGLADLFVREWTRKNRLGIVVHRPVGRDPPPHVTQDWITGVHTPPEARTPTQQEAVAVSDRLADELLSADVILLSTPMYNLTVPSTLKAYIDQVVRIGKTVKLEDGALRGQAVGKTMYVVAAHGGSYPKGSPMASLNHLEPYLRTVFGFIGITDVRFINAEFLDAQEEARDKALAGAFAEILRVT